MQRFLLSISILKGGRKYMPTTKIRKPKVFQQPPPSEKQLSAL